MNDITLTTKDLINRLHRDTVGFDAFFQDFFANSGVALNTSGYPPYNIEKIDDNEYTVELAVAGFAPSELDVEVHNGYLIITGQQEDYTDAQQIKSYVYRGISTRQFKRSWKLAEHTEVESANIENGLLRIKLVRKIPEALLPRKITINK